MNSSRFFPDNIRLIEKASFLVGEIREYGDGLPFRTGFELAMGI